MASQQIAVDGAFLDNGDWRICVGPLAVLRDGTGFVDTLGQEFIIQCDDGTYDPDVLAQRYKQTLEDFSKMNARVQAWFDDDGEQVADWSPGDGTHTEIHSSISSMPEHSATRNKLHCLFECAAPSEKSTGQGNIGADEVSPVGVVGTLNVGTVYFESRKFSKSVTGRFGPTITASAYGPFTLASVSNQAGKARFVMSGATGVPIDTTGLRLLISGSTNYNGTHVIMAIDQTVPVTFFDTNTDFILTDTGTAVIDRVVTGSENYTNARDEILTDLLLTGTGGAPHASTGQVLINEQRSQDSVRGDYVDFQMTSSPQSSISGVTANSGVPVERGLSYTVTYDEIDSWDRSIAEVVYPVTIKGDVAIDEAALSEQGQKAWLDQIVVTTIAKAQAELFLGNLTEHHRVVSLDFASKKCMFEIGVFAGYSGTISYSQSIAYSTENEYQIWEDTDGFDHVQKSKASARKSCVISVQRSGEGQIDLTPQPPDAGGGFQWLLMKHTTANNRNPLQTPFTDNLYTQNEEFTYLRIKPRNGQVAGGTGVVGGPTSGASGPITGN